MSDSSPFAIATAVGAACGAVSAAWQGFTAVKGKHGNPTARINALEDVVDELRRQVQEEKSQVRLFFEQLRGQLRVDIGSLRDRLAWSEDRADERHTANLTRGEQRDEKLDNMNASINDLIKTLASKPDRSEIPPRRRASD